jgi:ribosome-binding protein aMBF1 (putative translation factor)
MPKYRSFDATIRDAVRADGRSLYRLAQDCGVDVAVIQRFMSGERGITLATAEKICRAIGLRLL